MWLEYLKNKIIDDKEIIDKLFDIDNNENGTNYSYDFLINVIDKNIDIDLGNSKIVLLEGNFYLLIRLLLKDNIKILIITKDSYSINKWIKKVYEEYSRIYEINNPNNIIIDENFNVLNELVTIIGSNAFILENKERVNAIKTIEFEI